MLQLFKKYCEGIAGEPFKGSIKCLFLSFVAMCLAFVFFASVVYNIHLTLSGQSAAASWAASLVFLGFVFLYGALIAAFAWLFRLSRSHSKT